MTKPVTLYRPNWKMWCHTPVAKLWEAVALSCDLEPECLIQRGGLQVTLKQNLAIRFFDEAFSHQDVIEYGNRLEIAKRNVWQGGELRVTEASSKDVNFKVRLSDFAEFARLTGWALPADFPGKEKGSSGERIVHKQKTRLQEEAILEELHRLGFNPKALPTKRGAKGAKAAVLQRISSNKTLFQSMNVFEKAWDRLRQEGQISNS